MKSGKHTISCRLARSRRKKLSNVQCNTLHDVYIDCSHCAVHACQLPMCQLKTPKSKWCRLVINPNRQRGINITMQKGIQVANGRALCSSKKSLFLTFEFWFLVGLTNSRKKSKWLVPGNRLPGTARVAGQFTHPDPPPACHSFLYQPYFSSHRMTHTLKLKKVTYSLYYLKP